MPMWLFEAGVNDHNTMTVIAHGDTDKRCPDCNLDIPAQIVYPVSGNTYLHLHEDNKCVTRYIGNTKGDESNDPDTV